MKQIFISAIFSFFMVLSIACLAADDTLFDKLDANKDGTVTKDELAKQKLVIVPRKDGTKQVQHLELVNDPKSATAMTEEGKKKFLDDLDQDKDSSVSRKEWDRASPNGFVLWKY